MTNFVRVHAQTEIRIRVLAEAYQHFLRLREVLLCLSTALYSSLDSSNFALDLALIPVDAKGRRPPLDQPIHGFFLLSRVFSFPGNLLLAP